MASRCSGSGGRTGGGSCPGQARRRPGAPRRVRCYSGERRQRSRGRGRGRAGGCGASAARCGEPPGADQRPRCGLIPAGLVAVWARGAGGYYGGGSSSRGPRIQQSCRWRCTSRRRRRSCVFCAASSAVPCVPRSHHGCSAGVPVGKRIAYSVQYVSRARCGKSGGCS